MPEIRASVTVEVHRELKQEAARDGKHLKELVAEVLEEHLRNGSGGLMEKALKKSG
jgi:predicted HicB family RNase H-like nuclease